MLYALFDYLQHRTNFPGLGLLQYISVRTVLAVILSSYLTLVLGHKLIHIFQRHSLGEPVRDLNLAGQLQKSNTPTMGGLVILAAIVIPTLLFAKLNNIYVLLILFATITMGVVGFIDDYIKVFKRNKAGLPGKFKILGQNICGIVVGLTMFYHPDIVVKENLPSATILEANNYEHAEHRQFTRFKRNARSTKTNVPFFKDNQLDYSLLLGSWSAKSKFLPPLIFVLAVIFILAAVSNGANVTDGLDGLLAGSASIITTTLGILAYISGNLVFADYLSIFYIPNCGELMIFAGAFLGASLGFLWYNAHPAQIFMGDTGSLMIGTIIAVFAIIIRKELLLPLLCAIFLIENLSIIAQVIYFKYTKRRYGTGRRILLMAPLHHHFQKKGVHESKIVVRFWIIGLLCAILSIVSLKIR